MTKKTVLLSALGGGLVGGAVAFGMLQNSLHSSHSPEFSHSPESSHSPYVSQTDSPIRGLSSQEVDDLLTGRGAGYAITAELNSYPGPLHVLDLAKELSLSPEQEQAIQSVFESMQFQAQTLGHAVVNRETEFSQEFANGTMNSEQLKHHTQSLAMLYGQLRATHLNAHLQTTPLLSSEQIKQYDQMRGYGNPQSSSLHNH